MKPIGKHTLTELMPHIKEISFQYGLKINRVKDFEMIRKILIHRFYSISIWNEY